MDAAPDPRRPLEGRLSDIWGPRTPYGRGDVWPTRVDQLLEPGVDASGVEWVQSACVLCSNGCGLDIAVGDGQPLGLAMTYGGPGVGLFCCKQKYSRLAPGRLVGLTTDAKGNRGFTLTLQTREQHIRREKANSNICTSQVLLANIAGLYAVYYSPQGLKRIAGRIHRLTTILAQGLRDAGLTLRHDSWFDTLTVEVADKAGVLARADAAGINLRSDIYGAVGITVDETTVREDVQTLWQVVTVAAGTLAIDALDAGCDEVIPPALLRATPILTHEVFNRYHSETEMMRYKHRLERKDLALNQAMIPLGSCTIKLNAAAEMIPIT